MAEISRLTDSLYVGTLFAARRLRKEHGINVVVNVSCEKFDKDLSREGIRTYDFRIYDGMNPPLNKVADAITTIDREIQAGNKVLVNCHAGISRSVSICAGYLVYSGFAKNVNEAVRYIKTRRPQVDPSASVLKGVKVFLSEHPYDGSIPYEYMPIDPDDEQDAQKLALLRYGFEQDVIERWFNQYDELGS